MVLRRKRSSAVQEMGRAAVALGRAALNGVGRSLHVRPLKELFVTRVPGHAPGVQAEHLLTEPVPPQVVPVQCIDYGPQRVERHDLEFGAVTDFLHQPRPAWAAVRWIHVGSLDNRRLIGMLAKHFALHPLAVEDMLHLPQRPKTDHYTADSRHASHLFVVTGMVRLVDRHVSCDQLSLFLLDGTVLTFDQHPGDVWDPIRARVNTEGSPLRQHGADYLVYALLDAIVDHWFPILEAYGDRLEDLESLVLQQPRPQVIAHIHAVRRELLLLRRQAWPMRELISGLLRETEEVFDRRTRVYLRDVYDHAVEALDIVETYREISSGLAEMYISATSNRLNEVMKVLTVIATIFIPMTFLAGVYGMNFKYFPELNWPWGYAAFWGVCVTAAGAMLLWFRRRGWL